MTERAITFGPRNELVGILSTPDHDADPSQPAVLLWNVGVNHRVGPFRFHVDLARRLAAAGFVTLRFDASGVGDSDVRRQAVREADREPLDVTDAMAAVNRQTSVERFVLVGYCSSVDAAHQVALDDARVVGVAHIESYSYRTKQSRWRDRRRNLTHVARWDRAVRRRVVRVLRALDSSNEPDDGQPVYTRHSPTPERFTTDLVLLTRELRKPHLIIYGSRSSVNHVDQFWEMFDHPDIDRSFIDVRHFEGADHLFYNVSQREEMMSTVSDWITGTFPVEHPSTGDAAAERVR